MLGPLLDSSRCFDRVALGRAEQAGTREHGFRGVAAHGVVASNPDRSDDEQTEVWEQPECAYGKRSSEELHSRRHYSRKNSSCCASPFSGASFGS